MGRCCSVTALVNVSTEPPAAALATLKQLFNSTIGSSGIGQDHLLTEARAARAELEVALFSWRQMGVSYILSDIVMADIRLKMEKAKRLTASFRTRHTSATAGAPEQLGRQSSGGGVSVERTRTNNTTLSGFFGSILASMDNSRKREMTDGDEHENSGKDEKKVRKT